MFNARLFDNNDDGLPQAYYIDSQTAHIARSTDACILIVLKEIRQYCVNSYIMYIVNCQWREIKMR